jgi:hypothetical protein
MHVPYLSGQQFTKIANDVAAPDDLPVLRFPVHFPLLGYYKCQRCRNAMTSVIKFDNTALPNSEPIRRRATFRDLDIHIFVY